MATIGKYKRNSQGKYSRTAQGKYLRVKTTGDSGCCCLSCDCDLPEAIIVTISGITNGVCKDDSGPFDTSSHKYTGAEQANGAWTLPKYAGTSSDYFELFVPGLTLERHGYGTNNCTGTATVTPYTTLRLRASCTQGVWSITVAFGAAGPVFYATTTGLCNNTLLVLNNSQAVYPGGYGGGTMSIEWDEGI